MLNSFLDRTLPSSLTDAAEETYYVCAVMCNFLPPLCMKLYVCILKPWSAIIIIIIKCYPTRDL